LKYAWSKDEIREMFGSSPMTKEVETELEQAENPKPNPRIL